MDTLPYLIAILCLFNMSIYAQSSAQVTLSIRLYPIQTIEIQSADKQTVEVSNQDIVSDLNQEPISSQQLSTFSTCQFDMHIDSVSSSAFDVLRTAREVSPSINNTIDLIFNSEKLDNTTKDDELYVVYSMATL